MPPPLWSGREVGRDRDAVPAPDRDMFSPARSGGMEPFSRLPFPSVCSCGGGRPRTRGRSTGDVSSDRPSRCQLLEKPPSPLARLRGRAGCGNDTPPAPPFWPVVLPTCALRISVDEGVVRPVFYYGSDLAPKYYLRPGLAFQATRHRHFFFEKARPSRRQPASFGR